MMLENCTSLICVEQNSTWLCTNTATSYVDKMPAPLSFKFMTASSEAWHCVVWQLRTEGFRGTCCLSYLGRSGNVPSSTQTKAAGASGTFLHFYHTTQCQASVYSQLCCVWWENLKSCSHKSGLIFKGPTCPRTILIRLLYAQNHNRKHPNPLMWPICYIQ